MTIKHVEKIAPASESNEYYDQMTCTIMVNKVFTCTSVNIQYECMFKKFSIRQMKI